jgi:hypothetical protein
MPTLQQNWRKVQNRCCLEARWVRRTERRQEGRNDTSNVCTYEQMNKEKKSMASFLLLSIYL